MKFASLLVLFPLVSGLRLPVRSTVGKRSVKLTPQKHTALKAQVNAVSSSTNNTLSITDNQDLIYIVDATIGSQSFPLQLDSGSSDLWVDLTGKTVIGTSSSLSLNLSYGIGYVAGPIATADVSFAGFNISSQAYLAGTDVNNPATTYGADGVLGMGFTSLSSIDAKVNGTGNSWGRSLLYNIFSENPSEPNYVAYKLQRQTDNDDEGEFTIGELLPEFEGVLNTQKISTYPQNSPSRWTILVDKIIASGQTITLPTSVVSGVPSGKIVALPDTGTSLVFAPKTIVDALYKNIPGATWSAADNAYILDCTVEVDISVVINNRQFDIHPIDMVQAAGTDSNGNTICAGSWRPQTFTVGASEFDLLLGVAFMRSVYSVYDFGDFGSDNKTMSDPFILLWSTVNGSDASTEFHSLRGGTKNSTFLSNAGVNDATSNTTASSSGSGTGNTVSGPDLSSIQSSVDKLNKMIPILFAITGLNFLVLLIIAAMFFFRSSNRRRGATKKSKGKTKLSPPLQNIELPLEPETPGSYIALPRPRAPGMQAEYRPLSSGTTLRDSQLYDAPKSGGMGKFSMDGRYDPPMQRQSVAGIPEEQYDQYDPAPPRQSSASMLPPPFSPGAGDVEFPRQSVAMDNAMAPPFILETPPAARRSTAETLVALPSSNKFDGSGKLSSTSGSLSPQPRHPFGLTPPDASYDPAMRHSYAGYGETPKLSFDEPSSDRRSVISSAEVTFDPLLRRTVNRAPSSPDLRRDPFSGPGGPQQLVNLNDPPRSPREPSPLSQAVLHPEESSKDV